MAFALAKQTDDRGPVTDVWMFPFDIMLFQAVINAAYHTDTWWVK